MTSLKDQKSWQTTIENLEYVIKGKFGQVSLYSDGTLDVWVCTWEPATSDKWDKEAKRSEHRSNKMERLGWKAIQHYDDGGLFVRPFSDLDRACIFIKAKRKRTYSPDALQKMVERARTMAAMNKTRLQEGQNGAQ